MADNIVQRLKIREATAEDYEEAMRLSKGIFEGRDYLPAKFHQFVRDPNVYVTVAEVDGKLVGLKYSKLIDDGQTLLGGGARVHPDYRKMGVWNLLRMYMPETEAKRFVFAGDSWTLYRQFLRQGFPFKHLILRRLVAFLNISLDHPTPAICPHPVCHHHTVSLDKRDSLDALLNVENQIRLFPHRTIVSAWEPFRITRSNLERVLNESCYRVATKDVTDRDLSACVTFSLAQVYFIPNGLKYELEYYGTDPEDLVVHLTHHLHYIMPKRLHGVISLLLSIDSHFDSALIKKMLERCNVSVTIGRIYPSYYIEGPLTMPAHM